ncbi:MAG TPA: glycoside hydrolase family 44 protein [Ktedonobacterales bacterium]
MAQADTPETPSAQESTLTAAPEPVAAPVTQRRPRVVSASIYARPFRSRWQRMRPVVYLLLAITLLVGGMRIISDTAGMSDTFTVHVESEQGVTVDLRAAVPRSPYVFGVNAFPSSAIVSQDNVSGFMLYNPSMRQAIDTMDITMMRFPGGTWGEEHTMSLDQLDAFLTLAKQTGAQPLVQARLRGGTPEQAAALVTYTNNPASPLRVGRRAKPAMPVEYWVIGNEPDLIGPSYTVADYVRDFIAYATAMKKADPNIHILGPEISQYNGPSAPPLDSTGTPWLDGFLKGVAHYERAHHVHLLDGVSVHRYPFGATVGSTSLLFSSSQEWRYLIPLLQDQIEQDMGNPLPIGVTEINTSALAGSQVTQLATALWWADTLGTLIEERVSYIDFFGLQGIAHPYMLLDGDGSATPLAKVMELYHHMLPQMIPVDGASDPVSLYASASNDHHHLALMFINKSPQPAAVSIQPHGLFTGWPTVHTSVPAYGIVCVTMDDSGGGITYLYAPTATMVSHGAPGIIVTPSVP